MDEWMDGFGLGFSWLGSAGLDWIGLGWTGLDWIVSETPGAAK